MNQFKIITILLTLLLVTLTGVNADVSFQVGLGSGDYYQPVGDYDYLPYAYQTNPGYAAPRINFHDMMGQYGVWVSVSPFGQVWKPYASNEWRPYTQGHWITTQQHGQMWEGYEPWAWAGYHYGNWIYARNHGWVWIPGYDWHPGRVTRARSYDSIGWMPSPPNGYDYSRGYLSHVGANNQFAYNDDDFGFDFGSGNFGYGGPYYDPRYRNMYYNPAYNQINLNLWIFINNAHYGQDNYAGYTLGGDYTRHIFDRRLVRITNRQVDRVLLERITRQKIRVTAVDVRELQSDKQRIRVVVPSGADNVDRIRKQSKEVVRNIIAPGFAEKQKAFKGQNSRNKDVVSKIFQQEKVAPRVEKITSAQIIDQARATHQKREQSRRTIALAEKEKLVKIEKQGKLKEPKIHKKAVHTISKREVPEKSGDLKKTNQVGKQSEVGRKKEQDLKEPPAVRKQKQPDKAQNDPAKPAQKGEPESKTEADEKDAVTTDQSNSPDRQEVKSAKKLNKKSKGTKAKAKDDQIEKDKE